jgi:hypothetical protein
MVRCSTLRRIAALCLLMLTGFELFACEMLPGVVCEAGSSPLDAPQAGDDNCLCCCFHVVPVTADPPVTLRVHVYVRDEVPDSVPAGAAPSLELPPRL